jgi:tetratricopeptide (TPR) repeat protein
MSANSPNGPTDTGLRAAAEGGDVQAGVQYAKLLMEGSDKDIDGAVPWLEPAALVGDAYAARTLAILTRDRGEYERAERWYRAAADHDGGCAFGLATLLEKSGDLAGAAEWYDRGAALGSLECKTNSALLLAKQGLLEEAEERLSEALREGDHVAGHALDRIAEFGAGIWECVTRVTEAVRDHDPDAAADAVSDLDKEGFREYPTYLDEALPLYDEAAELAEDDRPLVWKALLLDKLDRWDDARHVLERAAERFPELNFASHVLSLLHREHGDLTQSERFLRRGAERGHAPSQWNLAVLCLKQHRLDEAQRWYAAYGEQADEENDKDFEAGLELVEEYRREPGDPLDKADEVRLPELRAAAEGGDLAAAVELARLLQRANAFPEAVKWLRAAAESGDAQIQLELGELLYDECDAHSRHVIRWFLPAAKAAYERARAAQASDPADIDPADVDLVERVGHFYLATKDEFNAEKWLRRAARLGRGKAAWWSGDRSDDYGDRQEAERLWALATRQGVAWCGWLAGRSMVGRGAYAEAEPLLRTAWEAREEKEPLHEAAFWLGRSLRGQGRLDEAADWLRTAVEVHRHVQMGYSGFMLTSLFDPRLELVALLDELERDDEAGPLVETILERHPRHRTAHRIAARIAERGGDLEAVRAHLEHVVDDPAELRAGVTAKDLRRIFDSVHPR